MSLVKRATSSLLYKPAPFVVSCSGELRTQKSNSHLVRTQGLNVLPLKPGVGQYNIVIHSTLTARDFFLAYVIDWVQGTN